MRSFFVAGLALACLAPVGCLKQETMTMDEVLKAHPREDQFVKRDDSIRAPKPETCLEAGRMYEALYRGATEPLQQRELAWKAKQAYTQAERLRPQWCQAVAGLARVHEIEGNVPAAIQMYQSALQTCTGKNSGDAACCHEGGLFFTRQKMYDQALACMQRAMQFEPGNRTFAMNYGFALARAGRFEESHLHFTKILSPGDAAFQVALMAHHVGQAEVCQQYASLAAQADPKKAAEAQALVASLAQPATEVQQAQAATATP